MAFVPSPEKPVIAVAGSTGDLGTRLINTFLSQELRDRLSGVVALARQHTPTTNKWSTTGAQIRTIDDTSDEDALITALDGVDVLVNAISTAGASLRDKLANVLPRTSIRLYFPSEFGVDHTLHDFNIPEWDGKKKHHQLTTKAVENTNVQVCRMFVGLFLHSGIAPWYGFHTSKGVYEAVGSPDQSISYTEISDIARVVCSLAEQAVRGHKIPEQLRIAGTHSSVRQTSEVMSVAGAEDIELQGVDLEEYKNKALGRPYEDRDAVECLRFLMGDGRIDYRLENQGGLGNDNEVVNPRQKGFSWKTVQDVALESKGRPNGDA